ncbi:PEP-CTERM sorting domain-containing protein [sulfur-oxidizing endosymbiont of Gigantopelta aegis]|uniref:PEP-CTERM sorting domain-containing protein n=1 Tax=sulfur-oxidizing endosymbiont of Gigantopelta aegis TaxID=2794934 RepID=UPI001BE3E4AD|nr:PEP-CTERM sorting domain-containing protein [sulfur-oxidizing endosymbiont of Gigantopelta aegis]
MWATGDAFVKSESAFLGSEWSNKTATIGGIAGSRTTSTINTNPLWFAWKACKATVSIICGDEPSKDRKTITTDTRTGAQLKVNSSGKVGLEFGYTINSGSVDAEVEFSALAELPEQAVRQGDIINLKTKSSLDAGSITTQSPEIEAYISAIMQLSGSVNATGCLIAFGCTTGTTALPTVNLDQRIISIDPNSVKILDGILPGDAPLAEVPLANQSLTLEGGATTTPVPIVGYALTNSYGGVITTSFPPGVPRITTDLAEIEIQVPNIETNGTLNGAGEIKSGGRDDLLSLQLDLDGMATVMAGLPPTGLNLDLINVGGIKIGASIDIIDVDAGPVLGLTQDFEIFPTLMTKLEFSDSILIDGMIGLQDSWTGLWSDMPEFSLLETTTFSPTYWIDVILNNDFGLDLGLVGTLDVLKLEAAAIIAGAEIFQFGPQSLNGLLGLGNELFSTDKLNFSIAKDRFTLSGFNQIAGKQFTISINVPEPGMLGIFAFGLIALGFTRPKTKQSTDKESLIAFTQRH